MVLEQVLRELGQRRKGQTSSSTPERRASAFKNATRENAAVERIVLTFMQKMLNIREMKEKANKEKGLEKEPVLKVPEAEKVKAKTRENETDQVRQISPSATAPREGG